MNDLRSRNRTLAPVPSIGPKTGEIVSTRPKSKGKKKHGNPLFQDSRSSADDEAESDEVATDLDAEVDERPVYEPPFTFPVSRELQSMPVTASPGPEIDDAVDEGGDTAETRAEGIDHVDDGAQPDRARIERPGAAKRKKAPASRPAKRREVLDDEDAEDDKFPWHYQFDDDEPEELQAKSPLLSRAFRSSVG